MVGKIEIKREIWILGKKKGQKEGEAYGGELSC